MPKQLIGLVFLFNSTFNVDFKRKLHEKQTRSEIWDVLFTSQPPISNNVPLLSPFIKKPIYLPLKDIITVTTPFLMPSSPFCPCTLSNRNSWTAKERRKAQKANPADDLDTFQKMASLSIIHHHLHFLIEPPLSSFKKITRLATEKIVILLKLLVLYVQGKIFIYSSYKVY